MSDRTLLFQTADKNLGPVPVQAHDNGDGTFSFVETQKGLTYLGEQTITMNGASQACTLPTGTNFVQFNAEGGLVQYTVNGAASANSGGYVPAESVRMTFKLENLSSLYVFGASPAKVHIQYFKEP